MAGMYGVTHLQIVTATESGGYLRLIKNPQGPTVTSKILEYTLAQYDQPFSLLLY